VAVIEFVDKSGHYSWYQPGSQAQDMFVTELVKSGAYRVVDREKLKALMAEKNLSLSGDVDPKTAVKAGKMLGVEYLITGAITEIGVTDRNVSVPGGIAGRFGLPSTSVKSQKMDAAIDARAIDTSTGEIVWADSAQESTSDSSVYVAGAGGGAEDRRKLDRLIRPVVSKLAASLSRQKLATTGLGGAADASGIAGKVAKVDGDSVFLNVGAEAGVKEGDEFDVFRPGESIKDPDTGEVLGTNEMKVGRVRVTSVAGPRLSLATIVTGGGVRTGDKLRN
jgi:curli biogenesis system outer membrane secretion channel CsgG